MLILQSIVNYFLTQRFLYDTAGKLYQKYRQRVESLRKGMVMESSARKREAEEKAIEEIDGNSGSSEGKGKKMCYILEIKM